MMMLLLHESPQAHVHAGDTAVSLLTPAIVVATVVLVALVVLRGMRALRRAESPSRQER